MNTQAYPESLNLTLTSPAQSWVEPVTLAEFKRHLNLPTFESPTDTERDSLLELYLRAARQIAEGQGFQNKDLAGKQWDYKASYWPNYFQLPRRPVASVDLFTYLDNHETLYVLTEGDDYIFDPASGIVQPPPGGTWSSASLWPLSAITIRFTTSPPAIDDAVKAGIMILAAQWFEGRLPFESSQTVAHTSTGAQIHTLPFAITSMLKFGRDTRGSFA